MTCKQTKTHQTGFIALTKSSIFRLKPKRNSFYIKLPVFTKNFRWLVNGGAWGWAVCFLSGILEHYDYCLCFGFFFNPPKGPPRALHCPHTAGPILIRTAASNYVACPHICFPQEIKWFRCQVACLWQGPGLSPLGPRGPWRTKKHRV